MKAGYAPDGSPIGLYTALEELEGDALGELARFIRPGSSVLELGCGTGRMTRQMRSMECHVTPVDESAEMLAYVERPALQAKIQDLRLGRQFDLVLMASHLMSLVHPRMQTLFVETILIHASPGGRILLELHNPAMFAEAPFARSREDRSFSVSEPVVKADGGTSYRLEWGLGDQQWIQDISVYDQGRDYYVETLAAGRGRVVSDLTSPHILCIEVEH